jgi:hypothetical protein
MALRSPTAKWAGSIRVHRMRFGATGNHLRRPWRRSAANIVRSKPSCANGGIHTWHLDEVFVKVNGKLRLSVAGGRSRRRGIGNRGHGEAGQGRSAQVSEAHHEEIPGSSQLRHRPAARLSRGDERSAWPTVTKLVVGAPIARRIRAIHSTTRTSKAVLSECEDITKVQFNSGSGPQSFQPRASSRDRRGSQTETLGRTGRVARTHHVSGVAAFGLCGSNSGGSLLA